MYVTKNVTILFKALCFQPLPYLCATPFRYLHNSENMQPAALLLNVEYRSSVSNQIARYYVPVISLYFKQLCSNKTKKVKTGPQALNAYATMREPTLSAWKCALTNLFTLAELWHKPELKILTKVQREVALNSLLLAVFFIVYYYTLLYPGSAS